MCAGAPHLFSSGTAQSQAQRRTRLPAIEAGMAWHGMGNAFDTKIGLLLLYYWYSFKLFLSFRGEIRMAGAKTALSAWAG